MSKKEDEKILTVDDVRALREEIAMMHGALAKDVLLHTPLIQKVVDRFVNNGLDRIWTEKLLASFAGSPFEEDEEILISYVLEELDSLLRVEDESKSVSKTVHVIVGATGIGKSSLVGKLGARYTYLLENSHKVAFLNFDQQKVGAIEQLENYADAMMIPLVGVETFVDDEYDLILVDTAGSTGVNQEELKDFLGLIKSNTLYDIKISLALSATSKTKDLERINSAYKSFNINNFIVTKVDETCDISDLMNFLIKEEKPVAYISEGQKIPEDLMVASKEYLLKQFMQEF